MLRCRPVGGALKSVSNQLQSRYRSASVLIMGAPGSGKGTIATKILNEFPFIHISTGDILRDNVREGTALGLEAKKYMEVGQLVPDGLMAELVADAVEAAEVQAAKDLADGEEETHVLLDGYPRNLPQAEALEERIKVDLVLNLKVPQEVIEERLTDRWIHAASGRVYAYSYRPPKEHGKDDETGEDLIRREDDEPAVVQHRLKNYYDEADPLLAFYENKGGNVLMNFIGTKSDEIYIGVKGWLEMQLYDNFD